MVKGVNQNLHSATHDTFKQLINTMCLYKRRDNMISALQHMLTKIADYMKKDDKQVIWDILLVSKRLFHKYICSFLRLCVAILGVIQVLR